MSEDRKVIHAPPFIFADVHGLGQPDTFRAPRQVFMREEGAAQQALLRAEGVYELARKARYPRGNRRRAPLYIYPRESL